MTQHMPFEERLALIRRGPDECWIWLWAKTPSGYGHFRRNKRDEYAHRAAYELLVGDIPKGHELDHVVCNTPSCCNPAHTAPKTKLVHVQRHVSLRTHCFRGHRLIPERSGTWKLFPDGRKLCMKCYRGWLAVRWDAEARAAYSASGKRSAKHTALPERAAATDEALQRVERTRSTHCENGHLRSEHGWKTFPSGQRLCLTCYTAKTERRNELRRSRGGRNGMTKRQ